jgi:ribosome maturation factor RimP
MALKTDQIRALAERVAATYGMEIVDVEFQGSAKSRSLRVFLEKTEAERTKLIQAAANADEAEVLLPKGIPAESLSGVTHEDCASFANDFGALLDVEDVVPGSEYTLEVSSPGLDRNLSTEKDFRRFIGSLVKLKTVEPIGGNKVWQGRLKGFEDGRLTLDLSAVKQKGKAKKATIEESIEILRSQIEKVNLVPEF